MIPRRFFAITVPYKYRNGAGSDNPFVKGSCNNGIDPLKSRKKSKLHLEDVAEEAKCNLKETPLAQPADTMEISVHNKMKMLFIYKVLTYSS